jgi:ABC transport system ATP-binding/permease protein
MTTLEIMDSNKPLGVVYLAEGSITIGRLRTNAVVLENPGVSRQHFRIDTDASGSMHVLEDLGSLNGTYVNGHRVGACLLEPSDEIQIGQFHLKVSVHLNVK